MHRQAVCRCGETASSRPPTQRMPADARAGHEGATAIQGSLAEPANELLPSDAHALGGCERGPGSTAEDSVDQAERQLLAAISAGSRSALRHLHMLYFRRLVRFFTHLTATSATDVIEDLVTDTMFDVWGKSATFERERSVHVSIMRLAYVHGTKRLAEGDWLRCSPKSSLPGSNCDARLPSSSDVPTPLPEVFAALRVAERAVVHFVHSGHSRQQVADILSMSGESVDAHLASSMIALHPWLASRSRSGSR